MENKEVVEVVVEQVAENTLGTTALTVLGTAVPVVGVIALGAKLFGLFSSDDEPKDEVKNG